jgi:glycosyltransferase involved in cell wall biosynthesis
MIATVEASRMTSVQSIDPDSCAAGPEIRGRSRITAASIWVVIPVFNDDGVLTEVLKSLEPYGYSIVVVDDGSGRRVPDHLGSSQISICRHIFNLGQGAALQTGIDYALLHGAKYLVTFDADGQHCAEDIIPLLDVVASGQYDIALGSRFLPGGRAENIQQMKLLTLRCALVFTRLLVGLPLTDTHNGLRALTAETARRIRITQNRMSHATQILLEVASMRLRYREVPVKIRYTPSSMKRGQSIFNTVNILWESVIEIFH